MEIILLVVGSVLEYLVIFALVFSIFKFGFREFWPEVIISCLMLTFVAYSLKYGFHLAEYSSFIQLGLFTLLLWGVFKFNVMYAILMSATFVIYGFWQVFVVLNVLEWLNVLTLDEVLSGGRAHYILQGSTIVSAFVLAKLIDLNFAGFDVPHGRNVIFKKRNNYFLLGLVVSLLFLFSMGYYLMLTKADSIDILVMLALSLIIMMVLGYLIARRNR
ncbi:hypothetical protein [Brevibacillus sp. HB2.2]|uniref:hypothetical protein n=1 Tax=Brevibacillus sp. HB2.2 TaxID=2738846 RepID=UPI00156B4B79|nr:hypothetical protein [Brevibacillus sp. HB2.2]NRS51940.1 hypothetical protein [Brevibacillus sp. HB2.2]